MTKGLEIKRVYTRTHRLKQRQKNAVLDKLLGSTVWEPLSKLFPLVSHGECKSLICCDERGCRVNYQLMAHLTWDEDGNLKVD
jgi:hypothetical protein